MNKLLRLSILMVLCLSAPWVLATPLDKLTINGYFSFEYEKNISGDEEGDQNGSFDLDLFDLVINFQPTDRLRIASDLTWEHGTATEDNYGNAAIEYAFAEYTVKPLFKVRVGKMFTHFGIYNEIHTAKPANLTVKEPLTTNKNNKLGSDIRFYPRWNTGIALTGDGDLGEGTFDYVVQVVNGDDSANEDQIADPTEPNINPHEDDLNTHKAVNVRFRYWPTDDLRVGASYYTDVAGHFDADPTEVGEASVDSYGVEGEYFFGQSALELEYVFGNIDYDAAAGPASDVEKDRSAFTAMISHYVTPKIRPYFRYEFLEPDDDADDDEATLAILGVNVQIDEGLYLKLEADKFDTEDANDKYNGASFTELKASVSVGF